MKTELIWVEAPLFKLLVKGDLRVLNAMKMMLEEVYYTWVKAFLFGKRIRDFPHVVTSVRCSHTGPILSNVLKWSIVAGTMRIMEFRNINLKN